MKVVSILRATVLIACTVPGLASPVASPQTLNAATEPIPTTTSTTTIDTNWLKEWWEWFLEPFIPTLPSICWNPKIRKEWRQLSSTQKTSYINAVKCLADPVRSPSRAKNQLTGARSRFDDFIAVHSHQTPNIHWVGIFLQWHRLFVAKYEEALADCGYTGGQPYWDWLIDSESGLNLTESPMFDPTTGFGGNGPWVDTDFVIPPVIGRTGGGCVQTGPFREGEFTINIGPTTDPMVNNPHCLTRDFAIGTYENNMHRSAWTESLAKPTFAEFARRLEANRELGVNGGMRNLHGGGHFTIGGQLGTMGDTYNSPGEPMFYLHHANLDRAYWLWEKQNLRKRMKDVGGPLVPWDYDNLQGPNATLAYKVNLAPLTGNFQLRELTNIRGGPLCYDYA